MAPRRKAPSRVAGQPEAKKARVTGKKGKAAATSTPAEGAGSRRSLRSRSITPRSDRANPHVPRQIEARAGVHEGDGRQRAERTPQRRPREHSEEPEYIQRPGLRLEQDAELRLSRAPSPAASTIDGDGNPMQIAANIEASGPRNQPPEARPAASYGGEVGEQACESANLDPIARLALVLESTLNACRDNSNTERTSQLLKRLTMAKALPTFSGNPLEWVHFKKTYEETTASGGYSEHENAARLCAALTGEAREAVSALLAAGGDAASIISTLELQYGNKQAIARKLADDIKNLPALQSGEIRLTQFASKLKNAVSAFRALNLVGHLCSSELIENVARKLPTVLKYNFNRYAAENPGDKFELERLADFLYREAELAVAGGIFTFETEEASTSTADKRKRPAGGKPKTYTASLQAEAGLAPEISNEKCPVCMRNNHGLEACAAFAKDSLERRWYLIKKLKRCFRCLRAGHSAVDCGAKKCTSCGRMHHDLLHGQWRPQRFGNKSGARRDAPSATVTSAKGGSAPANATDA